MKIYGVELTPACGGVSNIFSYPNQLGGGQRIREPHEEYTGPIWAEKEEAHTMKVSYNGFTGELVKLEKKPTGGYKLSPYDNERHPVFGYDLSIYDSEKKVTHSFDGVKLEDITFLGGVVSFG